MTLHSDVDSIINLYIKYQTRSLFKIQALSSLILMRVHEYNSLVGSLPLVLAGSAPQEQGQCGNSIKVTGATCGRARRRGEGFSKYRHLQEKHRDTIMKCLNIHNPSISAALMSASHVKLTLAYGTSH